MDFLSLCQLFEKLSATSKRLEKTAHIASYVSLLPDEHVQDAFLLLNGSVFYPWEMKKLGVASQMAIKALALASGYDLSAIEQKWKQTGDLGECAFYFLGAKKQHTLAQEQLTLSFVVQTLRSIAALEGQGAADAKIKMVAKVLTSASALEGKYLLRLVLEDLRIGIGESTLRDAVVWSLFGKELGISYTQETIVIPERDRYVSYVNAVQEAYDLCLDFSLLVAKVRQYGLEGLSMLQLVPGKPVKVMLYQKAKNLADAFERVGSPCAFEYKYDGFRLLINKVPNHTSSNLVLYTRRLEMVTAQFPDVVRVIQQQVQGESFILDAEIVGFDPQTKQYLPFQHISQRIQRKNDIEQMAKQLPVEIIVFDILYYNGVTLLNDTYAERRSILERIVPNKPWVIRPSVQLVTDSLENAEEFYKKALGLGFEGIMAKNLEGIYKPGSRVGYGVKVKPILEPLDVVIVKAEWGEGKRSKWLSSFTIAIQDDQGNLLEIGKVSSGLKEHEQAFDDLSSADSFSFLTQKLLPFIIKEDGKTVFVKPFMVLEVGYEEIQQSPTYSSGYALRFPRILRIRPDKPITEISTYDQVLQLFSLQKKGAV